METEIKNALPTDLFEIENELVGREFPASTLLAIRAIQIYVTSARDTLIGSDADGAESILSQVSSQVGAMANNEPELPTLIKYALRHVTQILWEARQILIKGNLAETSK